MAADVCDDVLLMCDGKPVGFGAPTDVLSENAVSDAFKVQARTEVLSLSRTSTSRIIFTEGSSP